MINSTPRAVKFTQHRARLVSVCLGFGAFVLIYTERQKNRVFALAACSLSSRFDHGEARHGQIYVGFVNWLFFVQLSMARAAR